MSNIENTIYDVILKNSKVEEEILGRKDLQRVNLVDDFGFDSIDLVALISDLEESFGIEISVDSLILENIVNVSKLILLISNIVHI